jgi:hypothetical protein
MLVSCFPYSSILKMKVTCSSETSFEFQRIPRSYYQEDMTLHSLINSTSKYGFNILGVSSNTAKTDFTAVSDWLVLSVIEFCFKRKFFLNLHALYLLHYLSSITFFVVFVSYCLVNLPPLNKDYSSK